MKKEILFAHYPKASVKRYQDLLAAFSNLDEAWTASSQALRQLGWKDELVNDFLEWKNSVNENKILQTLEREEIYCVTLEDDSYPTLLKDIYDPPFCLFVRGNINNINYPIAIVGPRKYSPYGKQMAQNFASALARLGFTIMSGLALGIDGIAHESALEVGGKTSAVLGSGINKNNVYPQCHKQLSEKIINADGAIISEYPPGTLPNKYTFPMRNRIVAGMSMGTLVIEGAEKSGALITAECALDVGREVFAIPQNITSSTASGVNNLLKTGSHLVTEAKDIVEILNLAEIIKTPKLTLSLGDESNIEQKILSVITQEPIHIDVIAKQTNLSSNAISSNLALLELSGRVRNLGSMMFVLNI